jgi:hypothetical protein
VTARPEGLRVELGPSLLLIRYLGLLHLAALLLLLWASRSPLLLGPGSLLIVGSFVAAWRRYGAWYGRRAVRTVELDSGGRWRIRFGDGRETVTERLGPSLVSPPLVILSFRTGFLPTHVALLADNADPNAVRRLRVRLRAGAQRESSPATM